ncbi:sulfatase-like hydrolase/transferase [bacterium]|nr:sulfatase-like hydrolase/transferase [bacterium]
MKKLVLALTVVVAALTAAVVFRYARPRAPMSRPHIVLIIVDTLRADRMGAYGYTRPTSPVFDRLASESLVFDNAFAPSSWTVPSVATMFTGLWPREHGVTEGLQFMGKVSFQHQLPEAYETIAERLAGAGYETYGYSTNAHITRQTGFGQGFTHFESPATANAEMIEQLIREDFTSLSEREKDGQPYFVFMHFFDPHAPYIVREPQITAVAPGFDNEAFLSVNADHGDVQLGLADDYFDRPENAKQLAALSDAYDSEIAATDEVIGRILADLPGADRAAIVFVSDHGEGFNDHGNMLHGFDLYNETVRVPLLVHVPEQGGEAIPARRVTEPVALVDVLPTLLTLGKAPLPPNVPGVDLRGNIPTGRAFPLHLKRGPIEAHGAIAWPYKLIHDTFRSTREMYDLAADPGERTNLLPDTSPPEDLAAAADAAATLAPIVTPQLIENPEVTDPEQLRSLGYLTGPGATPAPETPVSWVVELDICPAVEKIEADCGAKPEAERILCVDSALDGLKAERCAKASNFNYRKKCEFMRLATVKRLCAGAGNGK